MTGPFVPGLKPEPGRFPHPLLESRLESRNLGAAGEGGGGDGPDNAQAAPPDDARLGERPVGQQAQRRGREGRCGQESAV